MDKPIILNSIYEIVQKVIDYKKQNKKFPIGSFRLNPQGKLIPDPHGQIRVNQNKKKVNIKEDNITISSDLIEPIIVPTKTLPKKLTCNICKKQLNATKDRIQKLFNQDKLDSYICKSCKSK